MVVKAERVQCPGKIQVPTEKEQEALSAMKSIKERVRELKGQLAATQTRGTDPNSDEAISLNRELSRLKSEWEEWEEKRAAAAKERMIILGHEQN